MKLFKTITSEKQCEICWAYECFGADANPINSGITELCSEIEENTAYDIYLTDFFIAHHDINETDWWVNACDSAWNEGLSDKWIELVKKYIGTEWWLYGLYVQNMLVGYAVQRQIHNEEKEKTYNVQFNLDAFISFDIKGCDTKDALKNATKKLNTMSDDELRKIVTLNCSNHQLVYKRKDNTDYDTMYETILF